MIRIQQLCCYRFYQLFLALLRKALSSLLLFLIVASLPLGIFTLFLFIDVLQGK